MENNTTENRILQALAEVVLQRRKQLGYTQTDLQADAQLERSHISRIEHAQRDPRFSTIIHLEIALELPPGELTRKVRKLLDL